MSFSTLTFHNFCEITYAPPHISKWRRRWMPFSSETALLFTLAALVLLTSRGCDERRRNGETCFENGTWYTLLSQTGKFVYILHAVCRKQMSKHKLENVSTPVLWLFRELDMNLATPGEWATIRRLGLSPRDQEWLKTVCRMGLVLEVSTYQWRPAKSL